MKSLWIILLAMFFLHCNEQPGNPTVTVIKEENPTMKAENAKMKLVQGKYVIDVRTENEWKTGHVDGALLIPYDVIQDHIGQYIPDQKSSIVVYCRSGNRSGIAMGTLKKMGYANVENYGGYTAARKKLGQ